MYQNSFCFLIWGCNFTFLLIIDWELILKVLTIIEYGGK